MYSSEANATAVCSVIFAFFASLAVLLRVLARKAKSLFLGTDDYIIMVALVGDKHALRLFVTEERPVSLDRLLLFDLLCGMYCRNRSENNENDASKVLLLS